MNVSKLRENNRCRRHLTAVFWRVVAGPTSCEAVSCNTVEPCALTAYKDDGVKKIRSYYKIQL